jgi:hypothetical protein
VTVALCIGSTPRTTASGGVASLGSNSRGCADPNCRRDARPRGARAGHGRALDSQPAQALAQRARHNPRAICARFARDENRSPPRPKFSSTRRDPSRRPTTPLLGSRLHFAYGTKRANDDGMLTAAARRSFPGQLVRVMVACLR